MQGLNINTNLVGLLVLVFDYALDSAEDFDLDFDLNTRVFTSLGNFHIFCAFYYI